MRYFDYFQEIQIVQFDIKGTTPASRTKRLNQYKDDIHRRTKRAKNIGSLIYYDTPLTLAPNPENPKVGKDPTKSGLSYHVVEMIDTGGGSSNMKVQLLICDYNQNNYVLY
jgi:hypothetical protein